MLTEVVEEASNYTSITYKRFVQLKKYGATQELSIHMQPGPYAWVFCCALHRKHCLTYVKQWPLAIVGIWAVLATELVTSDVKFARGRIMLGFPM